MISSFKLCRFHDNPLNTLSLTIPLDTYLHNPDIISSVYLRIFGKFLPKGRYALFKVLSLTAVLLLDVSIHAGRFDLDIGQRVINDDRNGTVPHVWGEGDDVDKPCNFENGLFSERTPRKQCDSKMWKCELLKMN